MDFSYFSRRIIRILALFVKDRTHLEEPSEALDNLCEMGCAPTDVQLEGDFNKLAGSLLNELFGGDGALCKLMKFTKKTQVVHGYGRDEYILSGGGDF